MNWSMKRSRIEGILSSLDINTSSNITAAQSSQSALQQTSGGIPKQMAGISDAVLREIANNLETDDQMERLALALGCTRTEINRCNTTNRLTGSVTTKGTVDLLTSWRATVQPEEQMNKMREAMTKAKLLMLRDTVLDRAEKQLQEELRDYNRRQLERQQPQDLALSNIQETTASVEGSGDSTCSIDSGTKEALTAQGEPKYDIYLEFSQETDHVRKVKDIIGRNNWTVMTAGDGMLGVPKMTSIEDALEACSHVVLIVTKEDCEKDDLYRTMITQMALHSRVDGGWNGRVIAIRCCDERYLPRHLQVLGGAHIDDSNLEKRLRKTIKANMGKKGESPSVAGTNSIPPMAESPGILMSTDPSSQPNTAGPVGLEVKQLIQQTANLSVDAPAVIVQGNVYNIGSICIAGGNHAMLQQPSVIPSIIRQKLSQRLNGFRVTLDDWRGLAVDLGMDEDIDSLSGLTNPTLALIDLAESQKKICSLQDLEDALKRMQRDDCLEVLQGGPAQLTSMNRQMIKDRKRSSSSSDEC